MSAIRKYALCVETDPGDLVAAVTKLAGDGFMPVGGIAMAREPANPAKGILTGRTLYSQAMVQVWQPGEHPLAINGR